MRTIDQLDLLALRIAQLRERGFDQRVAAALALHAHPRPDVVKFLRRQIDASGDELRLLLFLPAFIMLSGYPHETYQLWVCGPRFVPLFLQYKFPFENPYRQTPVLEIGSGGVTACPQGWNVPVDGYLHTSVEIMGTAIFLIDAPHRDEDVLTLLCRAAASPAQCMVTVPDVLAERAAQILRPHRSFPIAWDPPLTLHYRSKWLGAAT